MLSRMTSDFTASVVASLPDGFTLPHELQTTFDWLVENGFLIETERGPWLGVYPEDGDAWNEIAFHVTERPYMNFWLDNPEADADVAVIMRTGGDGSAAGIWRDADGVQHFVHLGSGSGSTMNRVLTSDPVELLRLLAIGYDELCWPETITMTPHEVFVAQAEEEDEEPDEDDFTVPTEFQEFVRTTFGVTIPERAEEILGDHPDGIPPGDPFVAWVKTNAR